MSAYHPRPKGSCVRCNKNHDTPAAFLMVCAKCERAWHHTCHIPQVSEQEILQRLSLDSQGKRDAGLAGWQCKRCTKRARTEPPLPAAAPDQSGGPSKPAAASTPQLQSKPSLNGRSNSIGTTSSVPLQPRSSAPVQVSDDDDIIVLDEAPKQSQQPVADSEDSGNKPQFDTTQTTVGQQTRVPSGSLTPQPAPIAASGFPGKPQKIVKLSKTAQKRHQKSQLVVTPLPTSREPPTEEPPAGPSTQFNHPQPSSSPPPPPPESGSERTLSLTHSPTPTAPLQPIQPEPTIQRLPSPAPASANVKTISTADIRALISTMRSEGRLAPPPEVEYVHTHPRRTVDPTGPKPRRSGARKLVYTPQRTRSPELDEIAMDVDRPSSRGSSSDTRREEEEGEEEEDPHNIDDLYGDIAPRYRGDPSRRSKSRSKTAAAPPPPPPTETRLLFAKRDKRPPKADDLGLLLDKKLQIEGAGASAGVRAPRKATATRRLGGKALRKKQQAGLYFFMLAGVGHDGWLTGKSEYHITQT